MKTLSIFIDESGDFGKYEHHSPYYIFSLIIHDQSKDINDIVRSLDYRISSITERKLIHCGPIIRREEIYKHSNLDERRKIFNSLYFFAVKAPISVKTIVVDKKECDPNEDLALSTKLVKQLSWFIKDNSDYLLLFDSVRVYYDNGQKELANIIHNTMQALLPNVTFKKIIPDEYKLQQVADLFCTLSLLELKANNNELSESEKLFFEGKRNLKKNYLKILKKKEFRK